ncbi:MAG: hypothetical protein RLZZ600_450 [Actinomycetota bacterium]
MTAQSRKAFIRLNLRAILGIALITISAVGVWGLVRATSASASVLVSTRLLVEGQQIHEGDVRVESAGASSALGGYLATADLAVGKVVTRVIQPGELVPRASVGEVSETLETILVIDVATEVATDLRDGAIVDVWAAPAKAGSAAAIQSTPTPRIVMHRARLAHREVASASNMSGSRVEIVLPRTEVPGVLAALAAGDSMTVVASSGGLNS